jgi:LacI family repressor for deo operon, udp, cdd, tsx, nupC, and nupG
VPDISNPFFASVIRGAEEAARDAGYAVVVGDTRHDPEVEDQYAEMLSRREVDGLIFLGHRLPTSLAPLLAQQGAAAPIVNGCEYSPDIGVPSVHIDNAAASAAMVDHLVALGHRAIGLVTGPAISPISRDRLAGAMAAAQRAGLAEQVAVRTGDYSARSGFEQAAALLDAGVTALFCFSDEMALGAIAAVAARGLSCPGDISVAGFDDLPLARYFQPPLTTIAQPKAMIGRRTVELLVAILRNVDGPSRHVTLDHELVVRGSTARVR